MSLWPCATLASDSKSHAVAVDHCLVLLINIIVRYFVCYMIISDRLEYSYLAIWRPA